jgi:hypothetical protein
LPSLSCSIVLMIALKAISWSASGLIAGPSSTWQRPAGSPASAAASACTMTLNQTCVRH